MPTEMGPRPLALGPHQWPANLRAALRRPDRPPPGLLGNLCRGHEVGTTRNQRWYMDGQKLRPQGHTFLLTRQEMKGGVLLMGFLNPRVCEELKTSLWDLFRGDGKVLKLDCSDGCTTLSIY